jgi:tubulin-specific chaperone E
LDLSINLFPSWDTVALIAVELPALESLSLKYALRIICYLFRSHALVFSHNRLAMPANITAFKAAFSKLRELQISSTLVTWAQLRELISCMPSLRLLEAGYNRLHSLECSASPSKMEDPALQVINLDGNCLSQWSAVCDSFELFTGYVNPMPVTGE